MKWTEGKYEHRWRHSDNYWAWRDIGLTMLVTAIVCLVIVLLIVAIVICLAPRTATAGDIVNFRRERRLAAVVVRPEKVTTRASEPIAILICEITAYSPTVSECDAAPLITASGQKVRVGGIAADLRVLPFGSLVIIPGYNNGKVCEVVDTGGAIHGLKLDVFFWQSDEAVHWGRRHNVRVEVLYIPRRQP